MIVNLREKIVIITPPRCGSVSLHESCWGNSYICTGYQPFGYYDYGTHTVFLPESIMDDLSEYEYYIASRNPYDRLLSLYGFHLRHNATMDFNGFVKGMMFPQTFTFYSLPIYRWVLDFERKYPQLTLNELPLSDAGLFLKARFGVELKHCHSSPKKFDPAKEYTPFLIEYVQGWAANDFQVFDYPKEPYWL